MPQGPHPHQGVRRRVGKGQTMKFDYNSSADEVCKCEDAQKELFRL